MDLKNRKLWAVVLVVIPLILLITLFLYQSSLPRLILNKDSPHYKFSKIARDWAESNCAGDVPQDVCQEYNNFQDGSFNCSTGSNDLRAGSSAKEEIASACGCTKPYGTEN